MTPELQKKVDFAIRLLQQIAAAKPDIELCYSGGKDSDVILELARMAGISFTAIYKNTTIDPPHTIQHCLDNGVQIVQPKMTFFQMIEKHGFPSRFARFCCTTLKEYKIKDTAILGIRREESRRRAARYKEPTQCRVYSAQERVEQVFPILEWTQRDVEEFIKERGTRLHPLYYREDGTLDCSRRLGCLGCPLQSDRGLGDFKANPKLMRQWIRRGKIWWDTKPHSKAHSRFSDIYECFVARTFHDTMADMTLNREALFQTDWKTELEKYFNIEL